MADERIAVPPGSRLTYPNGGSVMRGEAFTLVVADSCAQAREGRQAIPRSRSDSAFPACRAMQRAGCIRQ